MTASAEDPAELPAPQYQMPPQYPAPQQYLVQGVPAPQAYPAGYWQAGPYQAGAAAAHY